MKKNIYEHLMEIDQTYMRMDDVYYQYANSYGVSETDIWILYSLKENDGKYLQADLCREWSYSLQTINTAIKNMEKRGDIRLALQDGNRKNKYIFLTEQGRKRIEDISVPLVEAERLAFESLTQEEQEQLLPLLRKHVDALKKYIGQIQATKGDK